jgi:hypothetical protein
MLQIEGLLAAAAWALIGFVVLVGHSSEDKWDGTVMLLLAAATLGAALYSADPPVALVLKVLLAAQALVVVTWLVRRKLLR